MKDGDKLYCHTACEMIRSECKTTTVENMYTVIKLDDYKLMIDDLGDKQYFSINVEDEDNWRNFFWNIRKLRRDKLKIINQTKK